MTKNAKTRMKATKKALFAALSEIEVENGIQILQCNEKFDALATDIVETTRQLSYAQYISELYYRVVQLKETIIAEIAAYKNNSFSHCGYVLSINT